MKAQRAQAALGLLLCATAACTQAVRETSSKPASLQWQVHPPQFGPEPQLWQASARLQPQDWLDASTSYGLRRADLPAGNQVIDDWTGVVATQSLTQQLSARVPDLPVEVAWRAEQNNALGGAGMSQSGGQQARVAAVLAQINIEVAATPEPNALFPCSLDAKLQHALAGGSSFRPAAVSLRHQDCAQAALPAMQAWTASADWNGEDRHSGFSLSRLQAALNPAQAEAAAVELSARHAQRIADWELSGSLAWRAAGAEEPDAPALWSGGASVQRELWHTPVSVSWRRHQPALWSAAAAAPAGQEAALALNLSPQLRRWLGRAIGADIAWRRLAPDDSTQAVDNSLHLGVRFDWR